MSLRARIFAGFVVLVIVTIAALGVPLLVIVRDHALDEVEGELLADAFQSASLVEVGLETRDGAAVASTAGDIARQTQARVTVTDAGGRLVYDSSAPEREVENFSNRPEIGEALSGRTASTIRRSETLGHDLLVVAVPVARGGKVFGAMRLSRDIAKVRADQLRVTLAVASMLLVLAALGALIASIISRGVTRPVNAIAETARRIGGGELSARAVASGPPEVRDLAKSLNDSAARVESAVATERTFIGNAAHQLRTPLTAMSIRIDDAADAPGLAPETRSELRLAGEEIQELSHLIEKLLVLSRTSEPGAVLLEQAVDVRPSVVAVAETWRQRLADSGVDLEVSIDPELPPVALPPALVMEVCENLLDNVAHYCADSGAAVFGVRGSSELLEIEVTDSGPGLDDEIASTAFDRFARGRSREPGSGLGLAVVRQVAEAAGGSADLTTSGGGTTVRVLIPAAGTAS